MVFSYLRPKTPFVVNVITPTMPFSICTMHDVRKMDQMEKPGKVRFLALLKIELFLVPFVPNYQAVARAGKNVSREREGTLAKSLAISQKGQGAHRIMCPTTLSRLL